MAEGYDKYKTPEYWLPTQGLTATERAVEQAQKMADFASLLSDIMERPLRLSNRVEAVGQGGFLRIRDRSASIMSPPEGEGDWELPVQNHVGEDLE